MKSISRFLVFSCILNLFQIALYAEKPKKWDQLSVDERISVQFALEHLFFYNGFAYTLYFDKPVSLERIVIKDFWQMQPRFMFFTPELWGKFLSKGLTILDEQLLNKPMKNYIFLFGQQDPHLQTEDVILIQKKAFIEMVDCHLPLFREKLGQKLTGESLLQLIEQKKGTFMSLINFDDELLGILLGYGAHNAHLFSQSIDMQSSHRSNEDLSLVFLPGFKADMNDPATDILLKKYAKERKELTELYSRNKSSEIILDQLRK